MATLVRFDREHEASIVSDWNANATLEDPVGMVVSTEDGTALSQVRRTGLPSRVDAYETLVGEEHAAHLLDLGVHAGIAAPIVLGGRLWGAVSATTTSADPFPEGAEQRLGQFAELVAQALANAEARSELAASRVRMVQAADHERRRLERNLHDGAQQRLVGLALALRLAEDRVESDPQGAAHLLEMARTELGEALDELRELARGIHPAVLSDHGLRAALPGLASRCPIETDVESEVGRLDEAVEVAAYFTVSEALANVAKYSQASRAHVTAALRDGWLEVLVADDGVGGADPKGGSGLQGLLDRVTALGGTLTIMSPPSAGTRLEVRLPVASARG
jgi:signal transduction histidine kinase